MRYLNGLVLFLLLWFIFATFQWPNGSVRVHGLHEVVDPSPDRPSHFSIGKWTFEIHEGYVTELRSGSLEVYKDCAVMNKKIGNV